jgi:hypothetical protein
MAKAMFETPEGDDVEVDSDEVSSVRRGDEEETVVIELDDGTELIVVASAREVAADLGLDPSDLRDPEDDEPIDEDSDE